MMMLLVILLLFPLFAYPCYNQSSMPLEWWRVPVVQTQKIEEVVDAYNEIEYDQVEPEHYSWDNIYIENEGPEVILNPYE